MSNIGYLIVREDLNSPLISSQCLDVLETINKKCGTDYVKLIWFYRFDYIFRKNNCSLKELRLKLYERGISASFIPFISLRLPVTWWLIPVVFFQLFIGLCYVRFILNIRVVHCRSYHAGLLARLGRKLLSIKYIFDPRSPFPEENAASGYWHINSINYKMWKTLESYIINGADKIFVVSSDLVKYYVNVKPNVRFCIVPNNYPSSFNKSRYQLDDLPPKSFSLVYVGSFGHWNKVEDYLNFLARINTTVSVKYNMLFITDALNHERIRALATVLEIDDGCIDIISLSQDDVFDYLSRCFCGVYLMSRPDPRLGVKTVEYLKAGLPIVVSRNIMGAAHIVASSNLGFVWDHTDRGIEEASRYLDLLKANIVAVSERCSVYADKNFAPAKIADLIISNYASCVNPEEDIS